MSPNLNDLSEFLKKDDIKTGDILTFVNEGEIKNVDFSKAKDGSNMKTVFQIKVQLPDGREKVATINRTSQESLGVVYGKITSEWIDKKATVNYIKQLAFGKVMDILVLEPIP